MPPAHEDSAPILVCGLGSIGRECVRALESYAVSALTLDTRADAETRAPFVRGDCRDPEALCAAGIERCRAVLLVTGDPYANIEAAMVARKLRPGIRVVVRTEGQEWSERLSSLLGNAVAFEPNRLAAGALAIASIATEVIGHFRVGGAMHRVVRRAVGVGNEWLGLTVDEVQVHGPAVLDVSPAGAEPATSGDLFHRFDPARPIAPGDVVTILASGADPAARAGAGAVAARTRAWWPGVSRATAVVIGANLVLAVAVGAAMVLLPRADPSLSRADAFFSALVMMTGGTYADLFPPFNHLGNATRLFSVALSIIGTIGAGLLYAWLTDQLLKARFRLPRRRPAPPSSGHVVVVGLGRVGRQAAEALRELGYPVAAIETRPVDGSPWLSVIEGSGTDRASLDAAHVTGARGLLAATEADWVNFEIALQARAAHPELAVVMRARDPRFTGNVGGALPGVRVLCVPLLAAKTFAVAALGESVVDLFQLGTRTVFVVEYRAEEGDGLAGELLSSIAEGYSVIPVAHAAADQALTTWSPLHHTRRVLAGDRLVLMGPSRSLQAIERRAPRAPRVRVTIEKLLPIGDAIGITRVLSHELSYSLEQAQRVAGALPARLPEALHPHQAHRLIAALAKAGAAATLAVDPGPGPASDRGTSAG